MKRILIASLCLAGALQAQTTMKRIPAALASNPGNSNVVSFGADHAGRLQQLVLASAFGSKPGVIREVAIRADEVAWLMNAFTLNQVRLTIGYSSRTPTTMNTLFVANRAGPMTTVASGSFNMPGTQAVLPPATTFPFAIRWKFSQPFTFNPNQANLLLEWEVPGTAQTPTRYNFDTHVPSTSTGTFAIARTSGPFFNREQAKPSCNTQLLTSGGSISLSAGPFSRIYGSVLLLGFSNARWGSIALPLNMTGFGAPLNWLHTSPDFVAFTAWQQTGSTWQVNCTIPLPKDHGFDGAQLYSQFLFVDPQANPSGIVFFFGTDMQIAQTEPFGAMVLSQNSTSLSGTVRANEGMPLELVGTFP